MSRSSTDQISSMPPPTGYGEWLAGLKRHVAAARQRAVLAANAEMVMLYWHIGQELLQRQQSAQWGDKVLDRLGSDLREAFPGVKGFSARNLKYMRYFAEHCPQQAFGQHAAAQFPWFHIVILLTKLRTQEDRAWYAQEALAGGWSRSTLEASIRDQLRERTGERGAS